MQEYTLEEITASFNTYSEYITKKWQPVKALSNEDKLILYGFYKQAMIGDCNLEAPSKFNIIEYHKYKSWKGNKGVTQYDAMVSYITKAQDLIEKS